MNLDSKKGFTGSRKLQIKKSPMLRHRRYIKDKKELDIAWVSIFDTSFFYSIYQIDKIDPSRRFFFGQICKKR